MSFEQCLKTIASIATHHHGEAFFTEGGCGVMAALFAEAAISFNREGEIRLMVRDDEQTDEEVLSHVVFFDVLLNTSFDVHGDDAETHWEESFNEIQQINNDPTFCFDSDPITVDQFTDVQALLEQITVSNHLNVGVEWIRSHYPQLRQQVLQLINQYKPSTP